MCLDRSTVRILNAEKTGTSIFQICAKYVERQIEDDEDAYYMKIVGERRKDVIIPAEKVWDMMSVED
jgi:hypothetical protein